MNGGSDQVSNRQLYDALLEIRDAISNIRVVQAGLPCREHTHALDDHDTKLRDLRLAYKAGDQELADRITRRQIMWTGGGFVTALAIIAALLGLKG